MRRTFHASSARYLLPAFVLCLVAPEWGGAQSEVGQMVAPAPAAVPVTVRVEGRSLEVMATGTVLDALRSAGVELRAQDECVPAPAEQVRQGMTVVVTRVETRAVTHRERIPARTRVAPTRRLRWGLTMIQQHPRDGIKEVVRRVTLKDDTIVSHEVVRARVLRPARDKVILVGGRYPRLPSRGGYFSGRRVMTMVASGYDPSPRSCGPGASGRTYLGVRARPGIAAVDPRVIPLGVRLHVEGYGHAVAADIGRAIKGNRIDLCFRSYREAARYGLRKVRVRILSE